MAAAIACRKRSATPFLDEVIPAPPHLAKRGRFSPCPGAASAQRPPLAVDPLDALRRVFPDAGPGELEACFAASGRDVHATVEACRARQRQAREREAAAARVASAAARADGGGMEECAGVLVEQMSAAADVADARGRASLILKLVAELAAANYALGVQARGADSCRFQVFRGPDVF
ncbi:hypothetical protein C2845_PM12G02270 [Panicum miliaceum]|uniref:CUE domain-containing protein n=1 Tax=Panicum miliaceum TaxID=4540 RepID=A0A3L6QFF4_PANMI|nr:hypothetical protein C2845_PM12G02270 [Panicum miliaceum]